MHDRSVMLSKPHADNAFPDEILQIGSQKVLIFNLLSDSVTHKNTANQAVADE